MTELAQYRPHDLLWLRDASALHSPEPLPGWVASQWQPALPVVVRRAAASADRVAVGIRGASREQRHALWASRQQVVQQLAPEALPARLANTPRRHALPALLALAALQAILDETTCGWGVCGSAGYELATGLPVLRAGSDLDLLIRCAHPPSQAMLRYWLTLLLRQPCHIDVQLETPAGAIALVEWARRPARVMVKTPTGPLLLANPWQPDGSPA
ncbi:malonate decarboxylase holo-ACP synthase [Vogesella sp. LIG4]|uniref:malonate decarboxylase holo-ACP synthase n=1 Tax=Vogesella sp. LIG4 TaxID=1192162 RepID=UPI00081FAB28|nr:malonate decarboxylase holo-ACP synthase [Vogesella sp. LIG4]SCK24408.1 phosphoribosyl-dephospho-CoA transferase [Vogesella sp. LIG4]